VYTEYTLLLGINVRLAAGTKLMSTYLIQAIAVNEDGDEKIMVIFIEIDKKG